MSKRTHITDHHNLGEFWDALNAFCGENCLSSPFRIHVLQIVWTEYLQKFIGS